MMEQKKVTIETLSKKKLNRSFEHTYPSMRSMYTNWDTPKTGLSTADLASYLPCLDCVIGNPPLSEKVLAERMNWYKALLLAATKFQPWDKAGDPGVKMLVENVLTLGSTVNYSHDTRADRQTTFNVYQYAVLFWWAWNKGTLENQQAAFRVCGYIDEANHVAKVAAEKAATAAAKQAERDAAAAARKAEKEAAAAAKKAEAAAKTMAVAEAKVEADAGKSWVCPQCSEATRKVVKNPPQFGFCPTCGMKRPEPKPTVWTCVNGHEGIKMEFNFCPTCGKSKAETELMMKQVAKPASTPAVEAPAAPAVEAPAAEAPKTTKKSTRSRRKSPAKAETKAEPKVEEQPKTLEDIGMEASVVFNTSDIGKTMNAVDLEEEKQPDLTDLKYQQFREVATPEQLANFDEYLNLFIEREFTKNANKVNAKKTASGGTLKRQSR